MEDLGIAGYRAVDGTVLFILPAPCYP